MGLLDLLPSSNLGLDGATPGIIPSANPASTLHNRYSITGVPGQNQAEPAPSHLDLDGVPPVVSPSGQGLPYMNHLPR
ncbi:hypothetical protein UFOVP54_24 [uncultured Caudovirales phage]|uniref:Uncharacterized protein n=1 Tax=uncultured Caudovirales phage TaxID=2100421 RepID=A0A6J5KS46_9CAUD|nr:hypothetical protein UFOVP54_24 [uncultured Caudovirales phage]